MRRAWLGVLAGVSGVAAGALQCSSSGSSPLATTWGYEPAYYPAYDASLYAALDGGAPSADAAVAAGLPGSPCTADDQCAGMMPLCRTHYGAPDATDAGVIEEGMCSSYCDPSKNDPYSYLNPDCPGTAACGNVAGADGGADLCFETCTAHDGFRPCSRPGYACAQEFSFAACYPASHAACDPTMTGVCPGGDGGSPMACVFEGPDDNVGECYTGCNPFLQDCVSAVEDAGGDAATSGSLGCYGNAFGRGYCSVSGGVVGVGTPCTYTEGCGPGLQCETITLAGDGGTQNLCEPFCGGPQGATCPEGLTCRALSSTSPSTTLGYCSP